MIYDDDETLKEVNLMHGQLTSQLDPGLQVFMYSPLTEGQQYSRAVVKGCGKGTEFNLLLYTQPALMEELGQMLWEVIAILEGMPR